MNTTAEWTPERVAELNASALEIEAERELARTERRWRKRLREEMGEDRWRLYVRECAAERRAVRKVKATLRRLLAETAPWVWHWGDGEGAWFADQLLEAAQEANLPVPRCDLRLAPVGPSAREIYERDAYRCQECGDWHDLSIDHIIPRSRGGADDPSNLRVLCRSCNSRKGARMPEGVV